MTNPTTEALLQRIGANIRRFRRNIHMSQGELARGSGVDRSYISRIENAKENPSIDLLGDLAAALSVTILQLIDERLEIRTTKPRQIQREATTDTIQHYGSAASADIFEKILIHQQR
jgi:transcriptional regulator with XRE-family HTH domain